MYTETLKDLTDIEIDLRMLRERREQVISAYGKAINKELQLVFTDYIHDNYDIITDILPPKYKKYAIERQESIKGRKGRYKYVFLTIAPYSEVRYQLFKDKINKLLRRKFVLAHVSTIEWTEPERMAGDPPQWVNGNMHFHTRIHIPDTIDPYSIKSLAYNTFKDITTKQCIQARYSNSDIAFIEYIKGYKKGDEKPNEYSKIYRELYGLPAYFTYTL